MQRIIEALLRARLFRRAAILRLRDGRTLRVRVREVHWSGSRSIVRAVEADRPGRIVEVALRDVASLRLEPESAPAHRPPRAGSGGAA